jgi:hypothetical protein
MNVQEDFQFLLNLLNEKKETSDRNENISKIQKAIINVMNFFITDFDKSNLFLQIRKLLKNLFASYSNFSKAKKGEFSINTYFFNDRIIHPAIQ